MLEALCRRFGGGPVGLSTLAVAVGEEPDTVETVAEPYLVREGYMVRTPRGRAASALAWAHLGLTPPRDAQSLWAVDAAARRRLVGGGSTADLASSPARAGCGQNVTAGCRRR